MRIALFQRDIELLARERNLRRAEDAFERLFSAQSEGDNVGRADLVVLPEMFATGFVPAADDVAESDGATAEWMRRMAARYDVAVAGSVAVAEAGRRYNRLLFVRPDGSAVCYDKRHLFPLGGEDRLFAAGRERVVVEWRGVRILLQICYDLRFPVFSRCRGDYDMMIFVASWPASRIAAWDVLLRARAIENQCYVAGVNRTGTDASGVYSGGTALIDPQGRTVAACADGTEGVITAEIDIESLRRFRREFPALDGRD